MPIIWFLDLEVFMFLDCYKLAYEAIIVSVDSGEEFGNN